MRILLLVAAFGLITLAACSSSESSDRPGAGATGGSGQLIVTQPDGSLATFSIDRHTKKTLMWPEAGGFLLYPSISPDGSRLAYAAQSAPGANGTAVDAGFDLWTSARDGTDRRLVFQHNAPNQQVTYPQWADASHLMAIVQERGATGIVYALERFDIATGERTRLLDDVLGFGLARGGTQIAFTRLGPDGTLSLITADGSGGATQTLLSVKDRLSPFAWPRYAPDGAVLAFTAAEAPGVRARQHLVSFGPPGQPSRDGAPQDVWEANPGGGTPPQRLADLKEDNPSIAWSGDGQHLYANGTTGLYDINMANGSVERIGDGTFHGHIAWGP